jgi:hypothetical protein
MSSRYDSPAAWLSKSVLYYRRSYFDANESCLYSAGVRYGSVTGQDVVYPNWLYLLLLLVYLSEFGGRTVKLVAVASSAIFNDAITPSSGLSLNADRWYNTISIRTSCWLRGWSAPALLEKRRWREESHPPPPAGNHTTALHFHPAAIGWKLRITPIFIFLKINKHMLSW